MTAQSLDKSASKLLALYRQSSVLPELIDAEICALVDAGHRQADIARLLELTPQEVSRRILRHRGA